MAVKPFASTHGTVAPAAAIALLRELLVAVVPGEGIAWLDAEMDGQRAGPDERRLGTALGLAGRKLGRQALALTQESIAIAQGLRQGWHPEFWATDEAARVALLLTTYTGDDRVFAARLEKLCATAELTEHISYLKGLAIFPAGEALQVQAREGARSSITPIFAAVACHNPYPLEYFDNAAWNQLVVKCVFVGKQIEAIVGLRERRNPELMQMLCDFIAERDAAGRPLPQAVHSFITE